MNDLPPESKKGDPQDGSDPGQHPSRAVPRGQRPGGGSGGGQNRHRSTRPPRFHERRPEVDPATLPAIREIEMPTRPHAVPYRRSFRANDTEWLAWVSGFGSYGTGHSGLATLQTLHFALAETPEKPLREVLMPTGRFEDLFDEELLRLFAASREIQLLEPGGAPQRVRRRGEGLS